MNIIGHKYIFLTISGILFLVSFAALGLWGLKLGIDYTGGSLLEIESKDRLLTTDEIQKIMQEKGMEYISIGR